ncbi:MAG: hypothetical protein M1391_05975 [Bacteroidetes bacterium]|nr:hypothetical protein [Bacteroidota bacterium]
MIWVELRKHVQWIVVFVLSLGINILFMPNGFRFNHDVVLSTQGLLIADSYKSVPLEISSAIPGYIYQGSFIRYANWPPLHFITLNIWQSICGYSLLSGRLLSILVTSITIPIFLILLLKVTNNKKLSFIGSIIFLFFPFRLLYGSLIFSDIWVPFFGCSALLFKFMIEEKTKVISQVKKITNFTLLGLYLGIGTLYSWQTFFLLPAFVIYDILRHKGPKKYSLITFFAGSVPFLTWIAWILISSKPSGGNPTISQFFNRSIIGFISSPSFWMDLLLKRVLKLIIDGIPLFFLLLIFIVRFKKNTYLEKSLGTLEKENLREITWVSILSIILYLIVIPGMFAPHEFQFILFHMGFTLLFIYYMIDHRGETKVSYYSSVLYVSFCLIIYFIIIPKVHGDNKLISNEISSIVSVANHDQKDALKKPILVINSNSLADSLKGKTLALTYLFNSFTYVMNQSYLFVDSIKLKDIRNTVDKFYKKMPPYLAQNVDLSRIYLISDRPLSNVSMDNRGLSIKFTKVQDIYTYSISR